jgi:Asp-tRNA(Asn)/Glu-tRNA(Gln) amidotransferase A subunit family amidase
VNLAGLPGISLPTSMTSEGKPMGFQLIAPFGEDSRLLQFSKGMEDAGLIKIEEPKGI